MEGGVKKGNVDPEEKGRIAYMILRKEWTTKRLLDPEAMRKEAGQWAKDLGIPVRTARAMVADLVEDLSSQVIDALRAA